MAIQYQIESGSAGSLAREDEYLNCIDRICRSDEGQGLFWFDKPYLLSVNATLVLADHVSESGLSRFAGGLYLAAGGDGVVSVQGAVVEPGFRGNGLLKRLAARGRMLVGNAPVTAVVRVYPDNRVNIASLLSLAAVGLDRIEGVRRATFRNTRFDGHLKATLEADGVTYRYLKLSADDSLEAARGVNAGCGSV